MGPSQLVMWQLDGHGRISNAVSEVTVLFDGIAAPLIYVSATQVSAMVPYAVAGASNTQVQVVYRGMASDLFQNPVAVSAPGIFSADATGKNQAAVANSDGSRNSATNPAAPGSYVTFYVTGEGLTDPPGSDGAVAAAIANVKLPVSVRIAGRASQLLYAGSAPGNVNGFAQINFVIPPDLEYGGSLPLTVLIGDKSTQSDIAVAVAGPPPPVPGAPLNLASSVNSSGRIVLTVPSWREALGPFCFGGTLL